MIFLHDKAFKEYISTHSIYVEIEAIAKKIETDYLDLNPLLIGVLNGSAIFLSDLIRKINLPLEISFIKLKSYENMTTSGTVKEVFGLSENIEGRHVIIVEDIVDTGITANHLINQLKMQKPASINIASLLLKKEVLQFELPLRYVGFDIPNRFVVGYGLDFDGLGRNLPSIYVLAD